MQKFGLALGGGGTKGAYHMGVWKALSELGIDICAVCGTSIGSLNGAVIAQGDANMATKIWENICVDNIVETNGIENISSNLLDAKSLISVLSCIYKNNGLETEPLKKLIDNTVNEEKLRNSDIDFGLVTFEVDGLDAVELFIDEIPKGKLTQYIMASAGLPGLKQPVIDDKKYLDGGFANNIPANMLIRRGIKNIITVDVGGFGIVKEVPKTGINHISIKCSENIIGHLDFDEKNISKMMKLGYFDCLKAFGRTLGNYYSFNIGDYHKSMIKYSKDILLGLEKAAKIYSIDNLKIYSVDALINGVISAYEKYKKVYLPIPQGQSPTLDSLKIDEKQILTRLCASIIEKKFDQGAIKFFSGLIKDTICAANAIAYFISNKK